MDSSPWEIISSTKTVNNVTIIDHAPNLSLLEARWQRRKGSSERGRSKSRHRNPKQLREKRSLSTFDFIPVNPVKDIEGRWKQVKNQNFAKFRSLLGAPKGSLIGNQPPSMRLKLTVLSNSIFKYEMRYSKCLPQSRTIRLNEPFKSESTPGMFGLTSSTMTYDSLTETFLLKSVVMVPASDLKNLKANDVIETKLRKDENGFLVVQQILNHNLENCYTVTLRKRKDSS